jgi:ABC-type uncharacterized transport system fused permease/ATPase subunit
LNLKCKDASEPTAKCISRADAKSRNRCPHPATVTTGKHLDHYALRNLRVKAKSQTMSNTPAATTWTGLFVHFFRTVYARPQGKFLLSVWAGFLLWAAALPERKRDATALEAAAKPGQRKKDASLQRLLQIAARSFAGLPGFLLASYVATLTTRILITVKLADLSGELAGAMGVRRWDDMFRGQVKFAFVCMAGAGVTALMKFLEKQVALSLRTVLFDHLVEHWLGSNGLGLVRQEVQDAPARLSSDLADFSAEATHLLGHFLKPMIDVVHLTLIMTRRIGTRNLLIFYAFFVSADQILKRVRARALPYTLKSLSIQGQELESELRDRLSRLHHYREQIAMQAGTQTEKLAVLASYDKLIKHQNKEQASYLFMDVISSYLVKYGGLMTAFSILTPSSYLDPSKPGEKIVGDFLGNSSLLGSLASAVKDLGDSLSHLPRVRGLAQRVYELEHSLELVDKSVLANPPAVARSGHAVDVSELTTALPSPLEHAGPSQDGPEPQLLTRELTFRVEPQRHTVIQGENGTGKTSLFRTLAGLWIPMNGSAKVPASTFFIPQDSYFTRESLARQITYPENPSGEIGAVGLLQKVGLGDLVERLHKVEDWPNVLSGGQKQRLGFARLLFHAQEGRAKFAFLDEPVSAVSKEAVVELVQLAQQAGVTLITISHSEVVDRQHERAVKLKRGGEWEVIEKLNG